MKVDPQWQVKYLKVESLLVSRFRIFSTWQTHIL